MRRCQVSEGYITLNSRSNELGTSNERSSLAAIESSLPDSEPLHGLAHQPGYCSKPVSCLPAPMPPAEAKSSCKPGWGEHDARADVAIELLDLAASRYQKSAHGKSSLAPVGWIVPAGVGNGRPVKVTRIDSSAATTSPSS